MESARARARSWIRSPSGGARRRSGAAAGRLRVGLVTGLVGALVATGGSGARAETPDEIDRRIEALIAERERTPLDGPVIATAFGAFLVSTGVSSVASVQWQCRDGDDCSDALRWGLTAGAGALALVGVVSVVLGGSELSKRLQSHREIADELCRLRNLKEPSARRVQPTWGIGFGWADDRGELRIAVKY
ncbi:MAG: hypothetical protein R3F21_05585 [Myxococcota bacterium]